ncbi:hypothetical protein [Planktotalea sp.]|uniref:hypothetical protein n=1 Tax=Planktotalea sp. TaxID=2029877 RepID=UPI0032984975
MGQGKKNEKKYEHYTKMLRTTMQTEAWRALSSTAQALYPLIKLEWKGAKANNNGKLRLSVRQAAEGLGCSVNTAAKAFHELQAKGFIVQTETGCLSGGPDAQCPCYEVTEIALPHSKGMRKLFLRWRPGQDFKVLKAVTNNPNGFNGRAPHSRGNVVPLNGRKA